MEQFQIWLIDFLHTLFPTNIWSWDYFVGLWGRYANFGGFLIGAIIIVIIYVSSDEDKKRGVVRIFALIALINALDGVYVLLMNLVNTYVLKQTGTMNETYIQGAFNPLSIMILVLIISECYRNKPRLAFFFGLSTFSVGILMFGSGHTNEVVLWYLFARVLIAATLCAIGSKVTYSFVLQLVMGMFFLMTETTQVYLLTYDTNYGNGVINSLLSILLSYKAEIIIVSAIVILFAVYEIFILTENKLKIGDFSLKRVAVSVILFIGISGGFVYLANNIDFIENEEQLNYSYKEANVSSADASSFLHSSSGNIYDIDYTIDGLMESCWQDGQDTDGSGETLKYNLEETVLLARVEIVNGNLRSKSKYYENNRIESARLQFYLDDNLVGEQQVSFNDDYANQPNRFELDEYIKCNSVVLIVESTYLGTSYNDLCVSEVMFIQVIQE